MGKGKQMALGRQAEVRSQSALWLGYLNFILGLADVRKRCFLFPSVSNMSCLWRMGRAIHFTQRSPINVVILGNYWELGETLTC